MMVINTFTIKIVRLKMNSNKEMTMSEACIGALNCLIKLLILLDLKNNR